MSVVSGVSLYECRVRSRSLRVSCREYDSTSVVSGVRLYECRVGSSSLRVSCQE